MALKFDPIIVLRRLLRPAVRFCLGRSLTVQDLLRALKLEFVDLSQAEISRFGAEVSVSKLSAVTGLQRKDLKTILSELDQQPDSSETSEANMVFRLIGRWTAQKRFLTSDGRPRVLSAEGVESDFSKLVKQVSSDLNHHTVLFQLERLGIVSRTPKGVQLNVRVYSNRHEQAQAYIDCAQDIYDLFRSVEHNLNCADADLNHHARTSYNNIDPRNLPKLRAWLMEKGSQYQNEVNRHLAEFDRDIRGEKKPQGSGRGRIVFGSFGYVEEIEVKNDGAKKK